MSDEHVIGHISWSPDFKSQPDNDIQRMLDNGRLKLAPRWSGKKLVSVDLVRKTEPFPGSDDLDEELRQVLRAHQEEHEEQEDITLLDSSTLPIKVIFTYTNWKGVTKQRKAVLNRLFWGCSEYHPEPQLLVDGYDLVKKATRTYALKDISDLEAL